MRNALLIAALLWASATFAAGGACPTGSTYTDRNNPTGAGVTLSSYGVTNCYFVAANGADTNTGTDESHPWAHAPQMPNCSNTCATVQNQSGGVPPGTGIIFRGGDTWYMSAADSNTPNAGGMWAWNTGQTPKGTAANPIYAGVDQTWFSGGSWARPILTGDNPLCNGSTLGANCLQNSNSALDELYYVNSCAFQIGTQNDIVEMTSRKYIIFDNFEMTGLCQSGTGQISHHDAYLSYGSIQAAMWYLNLYIHGWSHLSFADHNGGAGCTGSTVCFNITAFIGGLSAPPPGETIIFNVIDGSDSDPGGSGLCQGGLYSMAYSVIINTSQCITSTMHLFHDNLYHDFYENGHSNVLESNNTSDGVGSNAIYNNVLFNLETSGNQHGGVVFWPSPPVGSTDYIFNNLFYNVGNMEIFNTGLNGLNQGTLKIFNNAWQLNSGFSGGIFGCPPAGGVNYPTTIANNHYIMEGASPYAAACISQGQITFTTNLQMNNATATTDGYTAAQTFAFSPTLLTSPTVATGTNEQSQCSALTTAAGSDSTLSDAAAACGSDTRYACTYNTGNHTVSCPARTVVTRPISAPFDIGSYQFIPNVPVSAPAPAMFAGFTNLQGTVTVP